MSEQHEVLVVGAGLAGLTCARELHRAGIDVAVLERDDEVGGRIRTDRVDGLLLDRGFQLLNPAYPRARTDLDLAALDLQCFGAGAMIARGTRRHAIADPRRSPRDALRTATMPFGSLADKLRLVAWAAEIGLGPAARVKHRPDLPFADELARRGIGGDLVDGVLRPFLAGVLADDEFTTSRRLVELIVRSFVKGTPGVPRAGMQAIPEQIATDLPAGTVRCGVPVGAVDGDGVQTDDGRIGARAVVVAAGPRAAAELLGQPAPTTRSLTTFYHLAPRSPAERTLLHLDADRRGPLLNTAVMTDAAPSYAPGRTLVASTVLGADDSAEIERTVLTQLGLVYGADTSSWTRVAAYAIRDALPDTPAGTPLRRPVTVAPGLFVAGDHRDTASIQGALVSGHRAAAAVRNALGTGTAATA